MSGEIAEVRVGTNNDGSPKMLRKMTADQVVERTELNMAVTASALIRRARASRALTNGHH